MSVVVQVDIQEFTVKSLIHVLITNARMELLHKHLETLVSVCVQQVILVTTARITIHV